MRRRAWPLLLAVAAVLLGVGLWCTDAVGPLPRSPGDLFFNLTGEEALPSQVRGMVQWALGWLRPLPNTALHVPVIHTDLPPFGINTELEQEVEIEKRS